MSAQIIPWPGHCSVDLPGITGPLGNTEKMWDNSGRKKPHKTLKIRAGKMAVTVEILPR
jgi:hypothetical protein